ncbi:MAG: chromosome segregation protein SMC [Candidatus Aminicenantes bacterium RBG_13_62_12]|nr:MAG: chromosome segregation protein SMC [Candidatus Aminicenantes bacterium RBG_13_62_12]
MRFSYLKLENWRNFTRAEAELENRVFLVGPNASGKSNYLDIFRFLRDITSIGGGLQEATRSRGGVSRLRCLAARQFSDLIIDVKVQNEQINWRYLLQFNQDNRSRPIVKKEIVWKNNQEILQRPDENDANDLERLSQTHLEQVTANRDYRELAEFFTSIRYLHLVPQLIREPDRSVGKHQDPFGGDFIEQIARQNKRAQESRLRKISEALKYAIPQLKELELWRDERGTPHLRGLYEHWRPKGAWQYENQFSDGTLRMIGLLWALLDGKGPLLLEEPELSLHPEVVEFIPQIMARLQRHTSRQIFVSTHSPNLMKDEGIGLNEVLLLIPTPEGTTIRPAIKDDEIFQLLNGGLSMADAVFPKTKPKNVSQLLLKFMD